jgi:hypothetical protein
MSKIALAIFIVSLCFPLCIVYNCLFASVVASLYMLYRNYNLEIAVTSIFIYLALDILKNFFFIVGQALL